MAGRAAPWARTSVARMGAGRGDPCERTAGGRDADVARTRSRASSNDPCDPHRYGPGRPARPAGISPRSVPIRRACCGFIGSCPGHSGCVHLRSWNWCGWCSAHQLRVQPARLRPPPGVRRRRSTGTYAGQGGESADGGGAEDHRAARCRLGALRLRGPVLGHLRRDGMRRARRVGSCQPRSEVILGAHYRHGLRTFAGATLSSPQCGPPGGRTFAISPGATYTNGRCASLARDSCSSLTRLPSMGTGLGATLCSRLASGWIFSNGRGKPPTLSLGRPPLTRTARHEDQTPPGIPCGRPGDLGDLV